jgi:single-stranded-DNA-specific exonuclease
LGYPAASASRPPGHLESGSKILVVGDFDADGATSTALLMRALRTLGGAPAYLVPDRFVHGYGLSPALVSDAVAHQPALLITVDSGINCHAGVRLARELGMDVLVTDHHLPGEQLPPATAIVNPALPGQAFPSRYLAGVGVAFYPAAALARRLGADRALVPGLLDLVALGTAAIAIRASLISSGTGNRYVPYAQASHRHLRESPRP